MSKAEFFVVRCGATALPNGLIHDSGLSYAALALLTACVSCKSAIFVSVSESDGLVNYAN